MDFRISPLWYPLLGVASPLIVPWLIVKNRRYRASIDSVFELNENRINEAGPIELKQINSLEISVLVEWKRETGFLGDSAVSYLFQTESNSILYDIGFGLERPALLHNADKLDIDFQNIDTFVISHLHPDHMGGTKATRRNEVLPPKDFLRPKLKRCFLPSRAVCDGLKTTVVKSPQNITEEFATTGPLASNLFLFGKTEEQCIVAKIKGKGLVIFTGCGHPGIGTILKMVRKISNDPIYAIGGGLHLPITEGRGNKIGIEFQRLFGTGKPPWKRLNVEDLEKTIDLINEASPKKVYLSAHDTCDYSLEQLTKKLHAKTYILKAGGKYTIE